MKEIMKDIIYDKSFSYSVLGTLIISIALFILTYFTNWFLYFTNKFLSIYSDMLLKFASTDINFGFTVLIYFMFAFVCLLLINIFSFLRYYHYGLRLDFEEYRDNLTNPSTIEDAKNIEKCGISETNQNIKKHKIKYIYSTVNYYMLILLLGFIIIFLIIPCFNSDRLNTHFKYNITLLAPKITDQEVKELRASWARMRNYQDFKNMEDRLKALANEKDIKL